MLQPGSTVGNWEVLSVMTPGAMGAVYEVRHRFMKRMGVMKVPGPTADVSRFDREWRILDQLHHPRIVELYDVGDLEMSGQRYLVMRYIGQTLRTKLDEAGSFDIAWIVESLTGAAEALDAAAIEGVIHRDVKPSNLLVDSDGKTHLGDFGVAHLADATRLTASGFPQGTEAYMSPEGLENKPMTGASDQYSLAAVVFELLTGRAVFPGSALQAAMAHVTRSPDRPSNLNRNVSRDVDSVVLKALSKDPAERFSTSSAFMRALAGSMPPAPNVPPQHVEAQALPRQVSRPGERRSPARGTQRRRRPQADVTYVVMRGPEDVTAVKRELKELSRYLELMGGENLGEKKQGSLWTVKVGDGTYRGLPLVLPRTPLIWSGDVLAQIADWFDPPCHVAEIERWLWVASRLQSASFSLQGTGDPVKVAVVERDQRQVSRMSTVQVRQQFPNHGTRWTSEQQSALKTLFHTGMPFELAVSTALRTPSSVLERMYQQDLVKYLFY
jgi:hypothetical protein